MLTLFDGGGHYGHRNRLKYVKFVRQRLHAKNYTYRNKKWADLIFVDRDGGFNEMSLIEKRTGVEIKTRD